MSPFTRAKSQLILRHPFFGILVTHLPIIEANPTLIADWLSPTIAITDKAIYYNPQWVATLTENEKIGLLVHEVLHPAHGHSWRRGARDKKLWNKACDYAVNIIVKDAGLSLPKEACIDTKFRGKSAEEIYEELIKSKNKKEEKETPGFDNHIESDDKKANEELENTWKFRLIHASLTAKAQGKIPAQLERHLHDLTYPQVSWKHLLERFCQEAVQDDYDMQRQDRRFIQHGIFFPELQTKGGEIAVAIDTSGSIKQEGLCAFITETIEIIRCQNIKSVRLLTCDVNITMDTLLHPWDTLPDNFPGGGGTDFQPVFEQIENSRRPNALVYFTDGCGTWPEEEPNYPVLWIFTECEGQKADITPPFGISISYQRKK